MPRTHSAGLLLYRINNGTLEREKYLPATLKAWDALAAKMTPDGKLGHVQLVAASPGAVKPEDTRNFELGIKTQPFRNVTANITGYNTQIKDFQAQVTNGSVGVIRGYLANAEKVRVRGAELGRVTLLSPERTQNKSSARMRPN